MTQSYLQAYDVGNIELYEHKRADGSTVENNMPPAMIASVDSVSQEKKVVLFINV